MSQTKIKTAKTDFLIIDPPIKEDEPKLPIVFPFQLDTFQLQAAQAVLNHENALIAAHTGSGKTVPCLIAIRHYSDRNQRVIYTSPIKSLSNQKFKEFSDHPQIPDVGIMTGDIKCNPDAQCVIMTTEILRNILYKETETYKRTGREERELFLYDVGCVIFDEVHYINDRDRGKNWEESLIMLPPHIKLLMLSATIDHPESFASWIGNLKQQPIHLIQTLKRPIPLNHYIYCENLKDWGSFRKTKKNGLVHIMDPEHFITNNYNEARMLYSMKWKDPVSKKTLKGKGNPRWSSSQSPGDLNGFLQFLKRENYLPSLIFVLSRKRVEEYALAIKIKLVNHEQQAEIEKVFNHHMHGLRDKYAHLAQYLQLFELLKKGIGIHHSGLIPVLKEIVEILFSLGLIQVLFATETFAIGVNMPTKTVVFTEMTKWDGHSNSVRHLKTDEYMQMSGRAGRRGLDSTGTVIHFPIKELPETNEMKLICTGKTPSINSQMSISYQFLMKCMANQRNVSEILDSSLMARELNSQLQQQEIEKNRLVETVETKKDQFLETYGADSWNLVSEYHSLVNPRGDMFHGFAVKVKKNKKNEAKIAQLRKKVTKDCHSKFKEILKLEENLRSLDVDSDQIQSEVDQVLDFLSHLEYLDSNNNNRLTTKGLIASEINDCNCLILTEMIVDDFFDHLTPEEIIPLLAIFIDEKNLENQTISLRDLRQHPNFPPNLFSAINKLFILRDDLQEQEEMEFGNNPPDTDWNLNLDFVLPSLIWTGGGNVKEIYQVCNIYEGNFVKGMLRLQSMAEGVAEILGQIKQLQNSQKLIRGVELILRDIVTNNSLYVNQ